jgi:hypothetical protein
MDGNLVVVRCTGRPTRAQVVDLARFERSSRMRLHRRLALGRVRTRRWRGVSRDQRARRRGPRRCRRGNFAILTVSLAVAVLERRADLTSGRSTLTGPLIPRDERCRSFARTCRRAHGVAARDPRCRSVLNRSLVRAAAWLASRDECLRSLGDSRARRRSAAVE